jgi:hypothetical protein
MRRGEGGRREEKRERRREQKRGLGIEMMIMIMNHIYIVNMIGLKTDISDRVRKTIRRIIMTMMTITTGRMDVCSAYL